MRVSGTPAHGMANRRGICVLKGTSGRCRWARIPTVASVVVGPRASDGAGLVWWGNLRESVISGSGMDDATCDLMGIREDDGWWLGAENVRWAEERWLAGP